ncbi:hypothetical protein [Dyadobacter sp. CY351]|uniref:hypothetical protein n=1 Tax=Dyadobacter sp. CY351 TaxID=2909337 RepID=UPI001F2191B0|nr:hypothetical protein [Dyadobacter sp. CY351]MCF2518319.1 hypothetical protein [Dyadobacter sp. CY351]
MDQLKQLRMRQHRQTMLQMVSEIHQGKLNITQAANKFSVTGHTVKTWLDKVEVTLRRSDWRLATRLLSILEAASW